MEQNLALLKRLEEFNIDDSESSFPFSAKLARDQKWTPAFTARAIKEYKRFCYLAVVSGHPVSPSEPVDEVWHLHLTYSYNYWKVFCPEVLQMPFHHHPSKGGKEESAKFDDWSKKTAASYREAFGEDPPADIWRSKMPSSQPSSIEHYHIPKVFVRNAVQIAAIVIVMLVLVGCAESAIGNPLDMRGPDFLAFYVCLFVILFSAGWIIRKLLRLPTGGLTELSTELTPYSVAFLNGKEVLTVNTAITTLLAKQVLLLDSNKVTVQVINDTYEPINDLESAVYAAAKSAPEVSIPMIRSKCASALLTIRKDLVFQGLVLAPKQAIVSTMAGFLVALAAPIYGLMKIFIGIDRSRPVLFLEILCIVSVVACLFLLISPFRTRKGDSVLANIRVKQNSLRSIGFKSNTAEPNDVTMGMALFGVAALSGSSYEAQAKRLQPQPGSSSCGGGDASSGGGDGGGDGGGGGCGGCGGGD